MWNKCWRRKATWNGKEVTGCWTASRCFVSLPCSYRYVIEESDICNKRFCLIYVFMLAFASFLSLSCKSVSHQSWGTFMQLLGLQQEPGELPQNIYALVLIKAAVKWTARYVNVLSLLFCEPVIWQQLRLTAAPFDEVLPVPNPVKIRINLWLWKAGFIPSFFNTLKSK